MKSIQFNQNEGLDHVALCVRSLSAAQASFQNLGFQLYPGGKHEEYGTQNSGAWFTNDTYLELLTTFDTEKAKWLEEFLEKHEGAYFLVLRISSAHGMASSLRKRGLEIYDPIPGTWQQEEGDNAVLWHTLFLPKINLPGRLLFFIEYTDQEQSSRSRSNHPVHFSTHPNGSKKLQSIHVAIEDLERAAKEFEDIGFQVDPIERMTKTNALKRVINVGKGKIELIQLLDHESDLAKFIKQRGEGIFGFSIMIEDYAKAKAQLSEAVLKKTVCNDNEKSITLPPDVSHGAWIELKQSL